MRIALFISFFLLCVETAAAQPERCHYDYSVWNVKRKTSTAHRTVDKRYAELTTDEKTPEGCSPCLEDQSEVTLSNGIQFRACRSLASRIHDALEAALSRGEKIVTVIGYRAQMSRGLVDSEGNRTQLSNHAFGAAVDVNEGANGLYENCPTWSAKCKLRKAGAYRPGSPLSFLRTSPVVEEMRRAGFLWGGEIAGNQKDFMHFSLSGY